MLVREQEQIVMAVTSAYDKFRQVEAAGFIRSRDKLTNDFKTDPRVLAIAKAMTDAGMSPAAASQLAWDAARGTSGKTNIQVEYDTAIKALPPVKLGYFPTTTAYGELTIALASCNKKWPAIQTAVYGLMADLNAVTKLEHIDVAVRNFTKAIA